MNRQQNLEEIVLTVENVKNKKKVVDRGWEQGNVGWGVLGSFGSNSKDDSAQVIKRVEGKYIYI